MKRSAMLIGLTVSAMAFILIAPVFAETLPEATIFVAPPKVANNGKVWHVSMYNIIGELQFSAEEVKSESVVAYYWLNPPKEDPDGHIVPARIQISDKTLTLFFDSDQVIDLQNNVNQTAVVGELQNGAIFLAPEGPGFAWGRTR